MKRLLALVLGALAATVLAAAPALADSPHFNYAVVTSQPTNSITVAFKESGLGNSENSVTITLSGTAQCVNPGGNGPQAANKESFSVSGVFDVSNGNATGSLTDVATLSPPCSPPMAVVWSNLMVSDTAFNDSTPVS